MKIADRLLLALLLTGAVNVQASDWVSRAADSRLIFTPSLEGAEAPGQFHRFEVRLAPGESGPAGGHLRVEIDTTSADLFSHDINEAIAETEWFDYTRFPTARFESTEITHVDGARYVARGNLRLKGMSRPVTVPFDWGLHGASAQMRGSLILQRGDFHIGIGDWADDDTIAQAVRVEFDVALEADH
jgi:polyisoprenoid-binding protein YceI